MEQPKYFSDAEEQLLAVIHENDTLFHAIRNVMWEFPLTKAQQQALTDNYATNPNMKAVVRKLFLPTFSPDRAITQCFDLFMTLNVEGKAPADVKNEVTARAILIDLVEDHLNVLDGAELTRSVHDVFDPTADADQVYVGLTARNTYLNHIDTTLHRNVNILAQKRKGEIDPEKMKKDSSK